MSLLCDTDYWQMNYPCAMSQGDVMWPWDWDDQDEEADEDEEEDGDFVFSGDLPVGDAPAADEHVW